MMLKAIKDKPSDPIDFMSSLFLVHVETGLWKGKDSAPYSPPCPKSMVLFLFQCAAAKVSLGISIMLNDGGRMTCNISAPISSPEEVIWPHVTSKVSKKYFKSSWSLDSLCQVI